MVTVFSVGDTIEGSHTVRGERSATVAREGAGRGYRRVVRCTEDRPPTDGQVRGPKVHDVHCDGK